MSRAVIYEKFGGPEVLELREVEEPHAGPGQIRVRVAAVGLNPMDPAIAATPDLAARFDITLPSGFGYDFAGRVDEVGEGTTGFTLGERVYGGAMERAAADFVVMETDASAAIFHTPEGLSDEVASTLPVAGHAQRVEAVLAPLTLDTVQLFIDIERASAFIDGQYAQVVATLKQHGYPPHLFQLAATIADEGEQHFLHFRDIHRVLAPYSTDHHPVYLRNVEPGDPTRPDVAAALSVYEEILDKLITGYQREDVAHQKSLADARTLMLGLRDKAETLAKDGVGIPFLPFRRRSS